MNDDKLHVVLGAGQIGALLVDALRARGARVRQVRRGRGAAPAGVELRSGDLSDPSFAREACAGATVVYHCVNAPYDQWERLLLPLTRGVLAGVAAAGARLVMLDNLYMYGRAAGPMREDSPVAPVGRKGELRARQSEEVLAAHRGGDLRAAIARASDFYGPGAALSTIFGERYWKRLLAGKPGECLGDPDQPHSYSYTPDVAAGLLALGAREDAMGQVWHLPVNPARPTRALLEDFARAAGTTPRVARIPDWLLRAAGLFSPLLREVAEMTYQWKQPFVLDDARFRAAFGLAPTPLADTIAPTLAWARASYAPGARQAETTGSSASGATRA